MHQLLRYFVLLVCTGMLAFSGASFAASQQHSNTTPSKQMHLAQYGYHDGYGGRCRMVGGFWRNGYWHPPRRVCWDRGYRRGGGCEWVNGYWRHGMWYPGHRVCGRRW